MKVRKEGLSIKYRIAFILLIIVAFFATHYYFCIQLKIQRLPGQITAGKDINGVVLLYGHNICGICPTGRFLLSLKGGRGILTVVPGDFSDVEIKNLKQVFMLSGKIIRGKPDTVLFLKRIAKCSRLESWSQNIFLELTGSGGLRSFRTL